MYFVFCFFACFGFCCCFCLFDFSSSRITIYRSYNIFGRRSVDDRKAINFLIIEEKKWEELQNLISHEAKQTEASLPTPSKT